MQWNDDWLCYVCLPCDQAGAQIGALGAAGQEKPPEKQAGNDDGGDVFQLGGEDNLTMFDSPNFCNLNEFSAEPLPKTFRFGSNDVTVDATDDGSDNDSITNVEIPGWTDVCNRLTRRRVARERHAARREADAQADRQLEIQASKQYAMHIQPLPRTNVKKVTWNSVAGFNGQR